jgi:hypothetical protein
MTANGTSAPVSAADRAAGAFPLTRQGTMARPAGLRAPAAPAVIAAITGFPTGPLPHS